MHGLFRNEVAPVAPLLIPAAEIAAWWVVIAWCAMVSVFVSLLVYVIDKTVGHLPFIGSVFASGANEIGSGITNRLGAWSAKAHVRAGAAMHSMARIVDWMGHEIEQHSRLMFALAGLMFGSVTASEMNLLLNRLRHRQAATETRIDSVQRTDHAQGKAITHAVRQAHVAHATSIALPAGLAHTWDIPHLRTRTKSLEDRAVGTFRWIRSHPLSIATGAFVGAVALALSRIGLGWIRCSNVTKVGRRICGLDPNLIESLLLDTIAIVGTVSVVEFVRDAQAIEGVALDALGGFIREFPKV